MSDLWKTYYEIHESTELGLGDLLPYKQSWLEKLADKWRNWRKESDVNTGEDLTKEELDASNKRIAQERGEDFIEASNARLGRVEQKSGVVLNDSKHKPENIIKEQQEAIDIINTHVMRIDSPRSNGTEIGG